MPVELKRKKGGHKEEELPKVHASLAIVVTPP